VALNPFSSHLFSRSNLQEMSVSDSISDLVTLIAKQPNGKGQQLAYFVRMSAVLQAV
jgi:hypothetical protein